MESERLGGEDFERALALFAETVELEDDQWTEFMQVDGDEVHAQAHVLIKMYEGQGEYGVQACDLVAAAFVVGAAAERQRLARVVSGDE